MTSESPRGRLDAVDRLCILLRVAALVAGTMLAFYVTGAGIVRSGTLAVLAVFTGYSLFLYGMGWKLLRSAAKGTFYGLAMTLDFALICILLVLTGGGPSPFFYAFDLWVAVGALIFGIRGGLLTSAVVLGVLAVSQSLGSPRADTSVLGIEVATIIFQGLLVGFVTDRGRELAGMLREAKEERARAEQRLAMEQAKLSQEQKLSSLGMLTAAVAHEVNNPLSGLIGCVRTLQQHLVPEERQPEYFETVLDGLERMRLTLASLLDYSRRRPRAAVDVDVAGVVRSALRLVMPMLREKDLIIDERLVPPNTVFVLGDRSELLHAVVNVLMNALHAVPDRGRIGVSVTEPSPGWVEVQVADRGPGIPSEILGRVCEPFFTTKPEGEGTGLGLALTLQTVERYGGEFLIDSQEGQGTTVVIRLPVPRTENRDSALEPVKLMGELTSGREHEPHA